MSGTRAGRSDAAYWLWNSIERSEGGHERRRRLGWRMTEAQARLWEAAHGGKLERVDEAETLTRSTKSRPSSREGRE
jgi:hypothetical protein